MPIIRNIAVFASKQLAHHKSLNERPNGKEEKSVSVWWWWWWWWGKKIYISIRGNGNDATIANNKKKFLVSIRAQLWMDAHAIKHYICHFTIPQMVQCAKKRGRDTHTHESIMIVAVIRSYFFYIIVCCCRRCCPHDTNHPQKKEEEDCFWRCILNGYCTIVHWTRGNYLLYNALTTVCFPSLHFEWNTSHKQKLNFFPLFEYKFEDEKMDQYYSN